MARWPTEKEIDLARASFSKLAPHVNEVTDRFYKKLFYAAPEVKNLFPDDIAALRESLAVMFTYVIENLHDPVTLESNLADLGKRHRAYGVHRLHFMVARGALMDTLAECKAAGLTPAELKVWETIYQLIATEMCAGLKAA